MKTATILGAIILFFIFVLIIYHWTSSDAATVRDIASFCASLATIIGVVWAIISVSSALRAYKSSHSMRKKEIINRLYEKFLEDDLYELYEKIRINEPFELNTKNKKALNKALSLFDEIEYFKAAKLFDDDIWLYIAWELVNLFCHKNVQEFLKEIEEQYPKPKNKCQQELMPFTGFKALVEDLPDDYWFKERPPNLKKKMFIYARFWSVIVKSYHALFG